MVNRDVRLRWRVVDRSLQYRFLAMTLIYSVIIVFFLASFLFIPDILKMNDETLGLEIRAAAADRIITKHVWAWPFILMVVSVTGGHSFLHFQRIAGPLHRLRGTIERIRDGDLKYPIRIREKDYLHQEEKSLNEMLAILGRKLESIQRDGGDALESLNGLEKALTASGRFEGFDQRPLRTLRDSLGRLLDTARYFKPPRSEEGRCRPDL